MNTARYLIESLSAVFVIHKVDVYCDHGTQTALHVAVKRKQFNLASLLLNAGANPNLTIYFNEDEVSKLRGRSALDDQYVFTGSTVLVEAVRLRDMGKLLSRSYLTLIFIRTCVEINETQFDDMR